MFTLYKLFSTPVEQEALADQYRGGNFGYGHAKQALFEKSQEHFAPMQARFEELMADTARLEEIL